MGRPYPLHSIASQLRPRVETMKYMYSLASTSFTSMPKTRCRHSETWLKTTGKCSWLSLMTFFSISAWEVSSLAQYLRSRNFIRLAIISFRASSGKLLPRGGGGCWGVGGQVRWGLPLLSPQELRLHPVLSLAWVLKVFLGLAQLTHLDHKHDSWG